MLCDGAYGSRFRCKDGRLHTRSDEQFRQREPGYHSDHAGHCLLDQVRNIRRAAGKSAGTESSYSHSHQRIPRQTLSPMRLRDRFYRLVMRTGISPWRRLRAGMLCNQEHDRKHHRDGLRRSEGRMCDESRIRSFQRAPICSPRTRGHVHIGARWHH